MDSLSFILNNWQFLLFTVLGTGTSSGWLGYILANKSRKISLQQKAFKMQSEMIDSVKSDFEDRINYLQKYIQELTDNNVKLISIVNKQDDIINKYQQKYGSLDE